MRLALHAAMLAATLFFSTILSPAHAFATTILFDPADATMQDILSISGGFDATTLFLSVTFRPATFGPGNLGFLFGLDTDLNALTGVQPPSYFPLGADFTVFGISSGGTPPTTANVFRFGVLQGTVPLAIGVDTFSLAIPLALLGNDDGVANFGLAVGMATSPTSFTPGSHHPWSSWHAWTTGWADDTGGHCSRA